MNKYNCFSQETSYDCCVLDKIVILYQRKKELKLRKQSVITKCLFKTHQCINSGVFDEEPMVMGMLVQSKDSRGS